MASTSQKLYQSSLSSGDTAGKLAKSRYVLSDTLSKMAHTDEMKNIEIEDMGNKIGAIQDTLSLVSTVAGGVSDMQNLQSDTSTVAADLGMQAQEKSTLQRGMEYLTGTGSTTFGTGDEAITMKSEDIITRAGTLKTGSGNFGVQKTLANEVSQNIDKDIKQDIEKVTEKKSEITKNKQDSIKKIPIQGKINNVVNKKENSEVKLYQAAMDKATLMQQLGLKVPTTLQQQ